MEFIRPHRDLRDAHAVQQGVEGHYIKRDVDTLREERPGRVELARSAVWGAGHRERGEAENMAAETVLRRLRWAGKHGTAIGVPNLESRQRTELLVLSTRSKSGYCGGFRVLSCSLVMLGDGGGDAVRRG